MPEIVTCPQCERKLKVPESLAGQSVKCPSCGATFTATPMAAEPPPRPRRPPAGEDEAEEPPARRAPARRRPPEDDYEDDEDRPRRRRPAYDDDEDDEDDDRPRRRRRLRRDFMPHRGATVLTLGIISLVCLGIITGPIAWVMGSNDLKEIRAGRMDPEGEGTTRAGMICGMIATILNILGCVFYALIFAAAGAGRGRF